MREPNWNQLERDYEYHIERERNRQAEDVDRYCLDDPYEWDDYDPDVIACRLGGRVRREAWEDER